jgi:hypothetical protein
VENLEESWTLDGSSAGWTIPAASHFLRQALQHAKGDDALLESAIVAGRFVAVDRSAL